MKKRIRYTNEPMEFTVIPDFLPPPEQLRMRLKRVKVTIGVDATTESLFRAQAGGKVAASRQPMGKLLDLYAARQEMSEQ